MTRLAAEVWSIHIGDAAITCRAHDDKVDKCGNDDEIDPVAEDRIAKIDFWINGRYLANRLADDAAARACQSE